MRILNVIELESGVISRLDSFPMNDDAHEEKRQEKAAEELFLQCARENGCEEDDDYLLEGRGWDDENGYEVILFWSDVNL